MPSDTKKINKTALKEKEKPRMLFIRPHMKQRETELLMLAGETIRSSYDSKDGQNKS